MQGMCRPRRVHGFVGACIRVCVCVCVLIHVCSPVFLCARTFVCTCIHARQVQSSHISMTRKKNSQDLEGSSKPQSSSGRPTRSFRFFSLHHSLKYFLNPDELLKGYRPYGVQAASVNQVLRRQPAASKTQAQLRAAPLKRHTAESPCS